MISSSWTCFRISWKTEDAEINSAWQDKVEPLGVENLRHENIIKNPLSVVPLGFRHCELAKQSSNKNLSQKHASLFCVLFSFMDFSLEPRHYTIILSIIFSSIGGISYMIETVKGRTKPNKITWFMWSIAPMIASYAAIKDGVGLVIIPVFLAGFNPFLIFLLSFINKNAYWKLERFDYICGLLSLVALVIYITTRDVTLTIIFSILSDLFAGIPTLVKSWKRPETENYKVFLFSSISILISFLSIQLWSFNELSFSIYLILMNTAILFAIFKKKLWFLKNNI